MATDAALDPYQNRVHAILLALDISPDLIRARVLVLHREPRHLTTVPSATVSPDLEDADQLTPATCDAWLAMQASAHNDGVPLALVSSFRSVERQRDIIAAKLAKGQSLSQIMSSVAPPGYSEHHTGRAIDMGTSNSTALEEVFETTPSYAWLVQHAHSFGFVMSYPRNNPQGFVFEPWHWCFQEPPRAHTRTQPSPPGS